jgi:hypothetical protein
VQQLDEVQRWFLEAVTTPAPEIAVEQHILPSRQQTAAQRLNIYQSAYTARLLEVLQNLFPCTRFAVGDELFATFAAGYLQAHPPSSYTLARLADKFADYLEATRPADWGAFVVELVRLEQAIDRVFDAPGPERLPPFALPTWPDDSLRLQLVPGFELHRFSFPVSDYYTDWKAGREPGWPNPSEQFIALLRRDYIIRRYELTVVQYRLLAAIHAGAALDEAITTAASQTDGDLDLLTHQFHAWFALWAGERFFV